MTYILSPEQSQLYEEGGWPELRLVETIIEDLDAKDIQEEVVVVDDAGAILFALTASGGRPC